MGDVAALTWPMTGPGLKPWLSGPPQNARRCLFGPVDHKALLIRLEERQQEILEENKEKWNFDFENDKPLPGRYVWKCIGKDGEDARDEEVGRSEAKSEPDANVKKEEQTLITDFMRKRKLSNQKETTTTSLSKTRRRSST